MKQPEDYFYQAGLLINLPEEPTKLFERRAIGFQLWCSVCEGFTTYEEVRCLPKWNGYKPCPYCGLYATIQDIT